MSDKIISKDEGIDIANGDDKVYKHHEYYESKLIGNVFDLETSKEIAHTLPVPQQKFYNMLIDNASGLLLKFDQTLPDDLQSVFKSMKFIKSIGSGNSGYVSQSIINGRSMTIKKTNNIMMTLVSLSNYLVIYSDYVGSALELISSSILDKSSIKQVSQINRTSTPPDETTLPRPSYQPPSYLTPVTLPMYRPMIQPILSAPTNSATIINSPTGIIADILPSAVLINKDQIYILRKMVQGKTVKEGDKLDFTKFKEMINYIHSIGYCHLDLAPRNVINQNGIAKLIDFDLLTKIGSTTILPVPIDVSTDNVLNRYEVSIEDDNQGLDDLLLKFENLNEVVETKNCCHIV